mmetsp:Transcript_2646/g.4425  ORF Transcript_2646/g.4425 Transcript_2646/m.4425 type:complete len:112 (+) Transcript_2646:1017-1352(+)
MFEETLSRQSECFSLEQIEKIGRSEDCHIDDPEILASKKSLATKFTPLSLINAIQAKMKEAGITIQNSERKNPLNPNQLLFTFFVNMPARPCGIGKFREAVSGFSEYPNKK